MRPTVTNLVMPLRAAVFLLGVTIGFADLPDVDELALFVLCVATGGMLNFAFRSHPGELCRTWQSFREDNPDVVTTLYREAGPWLWRLGAGVGIGYLLALGM